MLAAHTHAVTLLHLIKHQNVTKHINKTVDHPATTRYPDHISWAFHGRVSPNNTVRPYRMKTRSSKFCPKCGEYWFPLADYVPKPFHAPVCRRCNVPVEPTGFTLALMALCFPIIIAFIFAMWPQGDQGQIFGTMGFLLLWTLPFVQWARQIRARRRFRKHQGEQCVPPNTLPPSAQGVGDR